MFILCFSKRKSHDLEVEDLEIVLLILEQPNTRGICTTTRDVSPVRSHRKNKGCFCHTYILWSFMRFEECYKGILGFSDEARAGNTLVPLLWYSAKFLAHPRKLYPHRCFWFCSLALTVLPELNLPCQPGCWHGMYQERKQTPALANKIALLVPLWETRPVCSAS
jgi:hypothetical protein